MVNHDTDPITTNLVAAMTASPRGALTARSVTITPALPIEGVTMYRVAGEVAVNLTLDELVAVMRGDA